MHLHEQINGNGGAPVTRSETLQINGTRLSPTGSLEMANAIEDDNNCTTNRDKTTDSSRGIPESCPPAASRYLHPSRSARITVTTAAARKRAPLPAVSYRPRPESLECRVLRLMTALGGRMCYYTYKRITFSNQFNSENRVIKLTAHETNRLVS
ncbi:hypothetical protein EVAR_59793_1 [Eumeta japonica]|uniref:Uncharacterized protein n=1 Tax=Eumeta variegata TaxID=151549 RepID=A0A4C1YG06_EUMVA|nr:hypothetical protein EVAR_59793_1 [Eumeta japonica]